MTQASTGTDAAAQTGAATQTGQQQQQQAASEFTAITSQEEFDKRLSARLERERAKYADYDDIKSELTKIQDANRSELDKATEKAAQSAKDVADKDAENARLRAAIKHKLEEADVAALEGVPADKVDALAERLAGGRKTTTARTTAAGLQSGAGNGTQQLTGKERAAAALRQLRQSGG